MHTQNVFKRVVAWFDGSREVRIFFIGLLSGILGFLLLYSATGFKNSETMASWFEAIATAAAFWWGVYLFYESQIEKFRVTYAFVKDGDSNPELQVSVLNTGTITLKAYFKGFEIRKIGTHDIRGVGDVEDLINVGCIQLIQPGDAFEVRKFGIEEFYKTTSLNESDGENFGDKYEFRMLAKSMKGKIVESDWIPGSTAKVKFEFAKHMGN